VETIIKEYMKVLMMKLLELFYGNVV